MRRILGIPIALLPILLAIMACAHSPQTYPPPDAAVLERPAPVGPIQTTQDAAPPPQVPEEDVKGEEPSAPTADIDTNQEPTILQDKAEIPLEEIPAPVVKPAEPTRRKTERNRAYDIPSGNDPRIDAYIKRSMGKDRSYFIMCLERFDKIRPTMERIFKEHGLPKDLVYVALVESGGNPNAVSPSGATGYWQFLPGTARLYGLKIDRWVDERRDLEKSTHAAAVYLNYLYGLFDDWLLACAAYNAGEGAILRLLDKHKQVDCFWDISHGMIYKDETLGFVPKILATIRICKNREQFGLKAGDGTGVLRYDVVTMTEFTSLERIAEISGQPLAALTALNPELIRKCTPPTVRAYALKVPQGQGEMIASALSGTPDTNLKYASYIVQKGDTLYSIARKHHTSLENLVAYNNLSRTDKLVLGKELIIPSDIYLKAEEKPSYAVAKADRDRGTRAEDALASESDNDDAVAQPELKKSRKNIAMAKAKPRPHHLTYSVKKGDTLWSISRQFAVSPQDIMRWNRTTSQIKPGKKLTIYAKNS